MYKTWELVHLILQTNHGGCGVRLDVAAIFYIINVGSRWREANCDTVFVHPERATCVCESVVA